MSNSPFTGPSPKEIPLANAPLVCVVAQVKFPPVMSIANPIKIGEFQEHIREVYPLLEQETVHQIAVNPESAQPNITQETVWRFFDSEKRWRVSLGTSFISIETKAYVSREDFVTQYQYALLAVEKVFKPSEASRLGLRYIDQVSGTHLDNIKDMIHPYVLGFSAHDEITTARQHCISEGLFSTDEGQVQTRWGFLPPKATLDANVMQPLNEPSWFLDIDMFATECGSFSAEALANRSRDFSKRVYSVFRWMVTDKFLAAYGGTP
jgi:uncharacterized protein (TIGR04255 family)